MTPADAWIYRPAYPDEAGRAAFVDDGKDWNFPASRWFVCVTADPPERIAGVIRYFHAAASALQPASLDFRLRPGPGMHWDGWEEKFLTAFLGDLPAGFAGVIRHAVELETGHPLERSLAGHGFAAHYRELLFKTPWLDVAERVTRTHAAVHDRRSAVAGAMPIPVRSCAPEMAMPLLMRHGLMAEADIRDIWNTPDPARLDRDASACLVLDGETLGVLMCADAGTHLRVMAVAGRSEMPGARTLAVTALLDHMIRTRAESGYQGMLFRANADTARQTRNLALRCGGAILRDTRLWAKRVG